MSKKFTTSPVVSFIIPTLNSAKVLPACLKSIIIQNYPEYEILIIDGGSIDRTLEITKKYHCRVVNNLLKTAEAAKALGLKTACGKFIAFIDSDNILPNKNWLTLMLSPFVDKEIIGTEPIAFTYRKKSGYIERYSALIGANDPYVFFNGNYDRYSYLTQKWTNLKLEVQNYKNYIKINIDNNRNIPTIGANGTIFRKNFLSKLFSGTYFFDIDLLAMAPKPLYFAKVKTSIIHTYCESSMSKFIKKQQRRLTDYYFFKKYRQYQWSSSNRILDFSLYSLLIFPSFIDSLRGYMKKSDIAWFFHPLACYLTWWIYFFITLKYKFRILKPQSRLGWQQ